MISRSLERPVALIRNYLSRQFLIFVFVGGGAAGLNWCSRIVFSHWMSFGLAVTCAYACGTATAFVLNRIYVFPNAPAPISKQATSFFLVNLATFPAIWGISEALVRWVFPAIGLYRGADGIAHAIAISLPVFSSFALHKFVTFRGHSSRPKVSSTGGQASTAIEISASRPAPSAPRGPF